MFRPVFALVFVSVISIFITFQGFPGAEARLRGMHFRNVSCVNSSQCYVGNNCTMGICSNDTFECVFEMITPLPQYCCTTPADCPVVNCSIPSCNLENFKCYYSSLDVCNITISPGPSSTPAATAGSATVLPSWMLLLVFIAALLFSRRC